MTTQFEISAPAVMEIKRRFAETGYRDPVATLGQATAPLSASPEFRDAIREGLGDEEMLEIGGREFENRASDLQFYLTIFVYEASECEAKDIVEISGVKVAMRSSLRNALRGLSLDFGPEGFVFRGPDGSLQRPFTG
jgi:hypothetical protein